MTQNQFKNAKFSKVMSFEAYLYIYLFAEERNKVLRMKNPMQTFYSKTNHRQYLSKFIESVILKMLRAKGADPVKVQDSGKYIDNSKTVSDILGILRIIGSGEYVKDATVRPGRADVRCFYNGKMYNLEVKVGADRMSEAQINEQQRATLNGEEYVIIKTIDDFLDIYNENWRSEI